jgi:hypothetical protein
VPSPLSAAPAAAPQPASRITTTDYGYVIGELRRIALLTALILLLLLVLWIALA